MENDKLPPEEEVRNSGMMSMTEYHIRKRPREVQEAFERRRQNLEKRLRRQGWRVFDGEVEEPPKEEQGKVEAGEV